jgi:dihydrofolate synthase/folylpolyglutamate synthase
MRSKYQQALDYLYSFTDYEKQSGYVYSAERFDLARVRRLMELLDNPHHKFPSIHIAGTKGKGSTSAMIASVLQHAGHRTGLYTSPHLHTFRERIQVNGELIQEGTVTAGVERLRAVAPQVPGITTFELITALALDHFSAEHVEWGVLEVGMGGRLDATNVVTPQVSVITSISYDHMMYLGDSLEAIATEKAGIIKRGVPVVSAPQRPAAAQVIARIAQESGAPLTLVGQDWQWQGLSVSSEGQQFAAWPVSDPARKATYALPLLGQHQQVNATTALAVISLLQEHQVDIPQESIRAGLASVRWPGRLEVLGQHPWVIVDGAHNGDSMCKLGASLKEIFPHERTILIWGVSADKDLDSMLDAILPAVDVILVTQAHHPRAADPDQLVERIGSRGRQAIAVAVDEAIECALSLAGKGDLICGTGSLFVVADLRTAWFRHTHQPLPPSDNE